MDPTGSRRRQSPRLAILLVVGWAGLLHAGQGGGSRGSTANPSRPAVSSGRRDIAVLIITGAVTLDDGAPAPAGARVECVCSARTKRYANVDSRGFFSIEIGGTTRYSTLTPDSSDESTSTTDEPPNRAGRRFGLPTWVDTMPSAGVMGCELRATLDGFRSNTVTLQEAKHQGQFDVGIIVLYPLAKLRGTLVSMTSLQAPKEARKALERAQKALGKRDIEKAGKEVKIAIQAYPVYAEAWFALGEINELEGHMQDARAAYDKALAPDSNYVKPYVALARLAGREQHWTEVAEITDRALSLDPLDFPEAYYLNSMAYLNLKQLDAAERSARKVLRLDPLHRLPAAYLILADILEQKLDFAGSLEQLRTYLQILPNAPSADQVRERIKALEESLRRGE